jgi:hypothetical protein
MEQMRGHDFWRYLGTEHNTTTDQTRTEKRECMNFIRDESFSTEGITLKLSNSMSLPSLHMDLEYFSGRQKDSGLAYKGKDDTAKYRKENNIP